MSTLALQTGVFLGAALLTGVIVRVARQVQLVDVPVARSSHSVPKPRGGGLAIVLLFLLVASHYYLSGLLPFDQYMALLGGGIVAVVGLADDFWQLDAHWRIPPQFLAACWVVWWLGDIPPIAIGGWQLESQWLLSSLAVLALIWLLNLYNFMDGIDGLAASELVFVNSMSLLLVINTGDQVVSLLSATLLTAGAGFLVWNWPPAKIFMGDVGSGFIGFSLGVLALLSMQQSSLTVWTWVILLGVFIVDATTTLLRRFWRGDKWYEGHATHAYQHAARQYKSHARVTITVLGINGLWLAPLAWGSVLWPEYGVYLAVLALSPLLVLVLRLQAGVPEVQPAG
ncbi:MAG: glycosyltransferase family 4 protein [Pseudohongiellaceae bacterium]